MVFGNRLRQVFILGDVVEKTKIRRNDRVEGEDAITGAADAGATPRLGEEIDRHIPRGLEVLIKKAAVDAAFKNILFEQRADAAAAIGLKLTSAEEAMLAAVPLPQLEGIVAHTRISPKLRPAFLGYAGGAMLAALSAVSAACGGSPFDPPAPLGTRPGPPAPPPGTAEPADGGAGQGASANGVKRSIEKSSLSKKDNPQA